MATLFRISPMPPKIFDISKKLKSPLWRFMMMRKLTSKIYGFMVFSPICIARLWRNSRNLITRLIAHLGLQSSSTLLEDHNRLDLDRSSLAFWTRTLATTTQILLLGLMPKSTRGCQISSTREDLSSQWINHLSSWCVIAKCLGMLLQMFWFQFQPLTNSSLRTRPSIRPDGSE